jgi:assimilatory nitrate reductase catalytic subunit
MSGSEALVTHTTCPYCGVGCGVEVTVQDAGEDQEKITVKGDKTHPANLGRLCSKGAALAETLDLDERLLYPQVAGQQVGWDEALDKVAAGLRDIVDQHGPDAVAFYVSGQLLTEDYYVANKLMKGFIGSANIDTNSRLCMSSSVAGHKRAFGSDTVPCSYTDLEIADLVVLTGSNTAWCHPVLFQRLRQAKKERPAMRIVVIDPRETESCDIADLHLPITPGADIDLFNGLLTYLKSTQKINEDFVTDHTTGFDEAMASAEAVGTNLDGIAQRCGLDLKDLTVFYHWFAETEKTVTVYSQGVNQWSCGTDKVNAIINCHLATGRIGKPGQGPFSFTGQPNAMGGREVGGLANQLAAHMDFDPDDVATVETFWQAPNIARQPGLKAVDLFKAIEQGKIKAVWIMATNPLVSMPEANSVRDALAQCELVIVSDCMQKTDTIEMADIMLPAATWGEKDGTVTNSERSISRQRAFLPMPGESKADWWIISEVAKRLGYADAFDYAKPADIWREYASMSGFRNEGKRDFDISALQDITDREYNQIKPVKWPLKAANDSASEHFFGDGHFYHADNKARLVAVQSCVDYPQTCDDYPLVLNTGRIRDQWHTMTRTGKSARLSRHLPEPFLEINPTDAASFQIINNQLVMVKSRHGQICVRALVSEKQKTGNLFIPMHWNRLYASSGTVGSVVNAVTDPFSGQPQFKHTPVSVTPLSIAWQGFLLTSDSIENLSFPYWIKQKRQNVMRYEIASDQVVSDWSQLVRELFPMEGDWIEFFDDSSGYYRAALIHEGRLKACLLVATDDTLPDDEWIDSLFAEQKLNDQSRISLLSGMPPGNVKPAGKTVCACFNVGINTIVDAIKQQQLVSVEAIGKALQAGTNCGSCLTELEEILRNNS